METNSFTWLKMHTLISNLKLRQILSYLILSPLGDEFARGAYSPCSWKIIGGEVLASFINVNKRIKGLQIRDHEIVN